MGELTSLSLLKNILSHLVKFYEILSNSKKLFNRDQFLSKSFRLLRGLLFGKEPLGELTDPSPFAKILSTSLNLLVKSHAVSSSNLLNIWQTSSVLRIKSLGTFGELLGSGRGQEPFGANLEVWMSSWEPFGELPDSDRWRDPCCDFSAASERRPCRTSCFKRCSGTSCVSLALSWALFGELVAAVLVVWHTLVGLVSFSQKSVTVNLRRRRLLSGTPWAELLWAERGRRSP